MPNRVVKLSVINDLVRLLFFPCLLPLNPRQICPNCAVGQHELFSAIRHAKEVLKLPLEFHVEFLPFRLINTTVLPQDYQPKVQKADFFTNIFGAEKFGALQESLSKWSNENGVPLCVIFA